MDLFRVRLNCIDHYQAAPTRYDPQLRNDVHPSQLSKATKVPVVRIFGSTETGQKVCAHIHGAFPYLYVEYEGSLIPEEAGAFIYRLHLSIDHALAVSYRRDQYGDQARFVARITLVKGIPFYGFHVGYKFFLKIYMFNPVVMTRLADLLQQGVIMKRRFQPYEAHLQYLLQFMTDYNLFGCDFLESSQTYFRSPVPEYENGSTPSHRWHGLSVPAQHVTDDPALPRASHCSIEVDICVQNIVNRKRVKERLLHHDFTELIRPPAAGDVRLVSSMAGLWRDEARRRQRQMPYAQQTQQTGSPFPPEVLISMSADRRDSQPQMWIHEDDYRHHIEELVANEDAAKPGGLECDFSTFVQHKPHSSVIKTALQSVEDLHPSNLMPLLGLPSDAVATNADPSSSIEVDENMVHQSYIDIDEGDFFPADSDEDGLRGPEEDEQPISAVPRMPAKHTLSSMPQEAARLNLPRELENLRPELHVSGISLSAFQTERLPEIPPSVRLLETAESIRLVGKAENSSIPIQASRTGAGEGARPKRCGSCLPTGTLKKRSKGDTTEAPAKARAGTEQLPSPSQIRMPSQCRPGDLRSSNQMPSFPIVEVRHDPNAEYSPSQNSRFSSQQTDSFVHRQGLFLKDKSACLGMGVPSLMPSTNMADTSPCDLETQPAVTTCTVIFSMSPPTFADVSIMGEHSLPHSIYRDAFYGNEQDIPARKREYAGKEFRMVGDTLPFLPEFDPTGSSLASYGISKEVIPDKTAIEHQYEQQSYQCSWRSWEIAKPPPSYQEVAKWSDEGNGKPAAQPSKRQWLSQIDGPTPKNKHGFKYLQKQKSTSVQHEAQYMSTMSLEVHVNTRTSFVPNPEEDEVQCIFWSCKGDAGEAATCTNKGPEAARSGILVICADGAPMSRKMRRMVSTEVVEESSELDLMVRLVEIVRVQDPDILTGYEVHGGSWGYLIERARLRYDYDLCNEFSRTKTQSHGRFGKQSDRWGFTTTSTIRVTGRHMINIWRAMRGELNLVQYTMENVVWHLLHRRIPHYPWKSLTAWYKSGKTRDLHRLLRYYQTRTRLDLEILESNELIPRTSEQARLLGVDFFSVFSRGSQFKVESIMFRIAKAENLMLVSPSRKQVGGQNALECLPLVMEPQSAFYSSPLVVLDFQSLYPSVMIAYNYCYSTFLGRITNWRGRSKMGFAEYKRQEGLLALLKDHINIAPNGMMYAKAEVRKSLLAKMLTEILETRIMVKSGMKQDKDDKSLQQLLNHRQLALKLLANVTYGYTSASFSGRMPCSEIADSIVQTGRETLERATAYIHSVERWGAEVVYGDTDSLFIYLRGRSRDQAFDIGNEIARAITERNPRPVKLKFEKVYHPCVLLAKKRYVGYKYESKEQAKPEFDAKGIETVRRDGTPAEQKMEEKVLRLLFETADLSQIKEYFQRQCRKIVCGRVSIQDFCFAKEVRLGTYSEEAPPPAGALISTKRMLDDARAEPQYGERVPYVVISGAPGARLVDRCVAPEDLLRNGHWQLDADYYISKNLIPPLERILNLVGANVRQWYDEMPKVRRVRRVNGLPNSNNGGSSKRWTLESYMKSTHCLVCGRRFAGGGEASLCRLCSANAPASLFALQAKLTAEEDKYQEVLSMCRNCEGLGPLEEVRCDSQDCPVFWTRMKQQARMLGEQAAVQPVIHALVGEARGGGRFLEW